LSIGLVEPVLRRHSSTVLQRKVVPPAPNPCQTSHLSFRVLTRAHGVLIEASVTERRGRSFTLDNRCYACSTLIGVAVQLVLKPSVWSLNKISDLVG
jgi:hypothetical protein